MNTPDTNAGHLTEKIMSKIKEREPEMCTSLYNKIYESVLAVLDDEEKWNESFKGFIK
ncbi:MAG: hypothetical protein M0R80_13275 [Proteobacteria bacterium]|jgi:hypothetical protein|nr:hypothetical protein [Pseudomonadota bacterium]